MIRDSRKPKSYFEKEIRELDFHAEKLRISLAEKDYKEGFRGSVSSGVYDFMIQKIFAMYSLGCEYKEIKKECIVMIQDYYVAFSNGGIIYKYYHPRYEGPKLINTLSLVVLCEIDGEPLSRCLEVARTAPKLKIIQHFLNYYGVSFKADEKHSFDIGYRRLSNMFDADNEELMSKKMMSGYLKMWYNSENRVYLRDLHKHYISSYCGYWAFDAAAFVKIRGIDDSSFRDNPYYPEYMLSHNRI